MLENPFHWQKWLRVMKGPEWLRGPGWPRRRTAHGVAKGGFTTVRKAMIKLIEKGPELDIVEFYDKMKGAFALLEAAHDEYFTDC